MDALERLIALEEIKQLRAKYWRTLDTKQWDDWGSVFTEDCTLKFDSGVSTGGGDPQTNPTVSTRQGMVDYVRAGLQTVQHARFATDSDGAQIEKRSAAQVFHQRDVSCAGKGS